MRKILLLFAFLLSTCSTSQIKEDTPWIPTEDVGCSSHFTVLNPANMSWKYYYGAINEACRDFSVVYGISIKDIEKKLSSQKQILYVYYKPDHTCSRYFGYSVDSCSLKRAEYISYINFRRPDSYDVTYHEVMHVLLWSFEFSNDHHQELRNKRLCKSRTRDGIHYCGATQRK